MTTAADLAARLERDLSALATDAGWTTTASAGQAQGNYTDPIADALELAEIDDITEATAAELRTIRRSALLACLDRLEAYYGAQVSSSEAGGSLSLDQLVANVRAYRENVVGRTATGTNVRGYRRRDYTLGHGNSSDSEPDPTLVYVTDASGPVYVI